VKWTAGISMEQNISELKAKLLPSLRNFYFNLKSTNFRTNDFGNKWED
jgi:hypothetical protein